MTRRQLSTTLILIFSLYFLNGCVSSLLKEAPPTFSNDIMLPNMNSPFKKLDDSVFPAWKNQLTNNVVSVISDCTDTMTSLKAIHGLMGESVENIEVVEEKDLQFQSQPAYFRLIKGHLGDHPIAAQSLSFKRKNCHYLASLSGSPEKIATDKNNFQNFLDKIDFKK